MITYALLTGSLLTSINCSSLVNKKNDADGDGIANKRDKCTNTPKSALVDKHGCIIDADKDEIADNLDACPAVFGLARFSGCPDSDKDGVEDRLDRCPNVLGSVKLEGCPDSDGDGIEDSRDKCPSKAGIAAFEGCPDTDGDGVEDAIDQCLMVKGLAKFEGCPDTDGDGIQENLDKCPGLAGVAANNGCPEIKAIVQQLLLRASKGIEFENRKATLKKKSFLLFDQLVKVMNDNPHFRLKIIVFPENLPDMAKNTILSNNRALVIKKYLENKGLQPEYIITEVVFPDQERISKNKIDVHIQFDDFTGLPPY